MSVPERIRKCAEIVGSGDELARKAEIPRRTLETYLSGESDPKASRMAAICYAAGINGHWLLTGEGEMLLNTSKESHSPQLGGNIIVYADAMEVIDLFLQKNSLTLVPEKKRQAVDALYHLSMDKGGKIDAQVAEMIMKLVA